MSSLPGHWECDTPRCGAVAPEGSEGWRELTSDAAEPAHLCPRCADQADRGVAPGVFADCACFRCGRRMEAYPRLTWLETLAEDGTRVDVCGDCHEPDDPPTHVV